MVVKQQEGSKSTISDVGISGAKSWDNFGRNGGIAGGIKGKDNDKVYTLSLLRTGPRKCKRKNRWFGDMRDTRRRPLVNANVG